MSSTFFKTNNDICYNNKEYLKYEKEKLQRKKILKQLENQENLKNKLLNINFFKELNIKRTRMKKIDYENEFNKKTNSLSTQEQFLSRDNTVFPLLSNDHYKKLIPNSKSLINIKTIKKEKDYNFNYLYLEYKKDNKSLDDVTYIKIEPHKIISYLIDFPNIKQIFNILTKKINKRNIKNPNMNKSDSKINIEEICYDIDKKRKNNKIDIKYNSANYINRLNTSSIFLLQEEEKNKEKNYPIFDLFLFDIINKVINKSFDLRDKNNQKIDEEFMFKEYKNQISKLKIFFYEKTNDKIITNNFIDLYQITKFENDNCIPPNKKYMNPNIYFKKATNKSKENNIEMFKKPISNIYNFDIGPKINIIDSSELLNKINKQKIETKRNSANEEFINKLIELSSKKIKFENLLIEEKTKLLNYNNNIFEKRNSKYFSRNLLNKNLNRKKLFIRSKIFHEYENESENDNKIIKEKSLNSLRKITVYDTKTNKSFSSLKEKDNNIIMKSKPELEEKNKTNAEKIIIEKLSTKNDFGVTKVIFNKTIDKINKMNKRNLNDNKSRMKKYNFSFLNSIYGKINTKRKMKINEIDFKQEIKNKGYQLLFNALRNPYLKLSKNKSTEDVLSFNKNKINIQSLDKATNTKEIKFDY